MSAVGEDWGGTDARRRLDRMASNGRSVESFGVEGRHLVSSTTFWGIENDWDLGMKRDGKGMLSNLATNNYV